MSHPSDLLLSYALGELNAKEQETLELHLSNCELCLAELGALQDSFVHLAESAPKVTAPAGAWSAIQARLTEASELTSSASIMPETTNLISLKPKRFAWQAFAVAASLLLFASGLFWGFQQRQNYLVTKAEQRKVAGWLSRPDVSSQQLLDAQGERLGSVLTLSDGRALFIFRTAPSRGFTYQAWGDSPSGERVSLGLSDRTLLEVPYEAYGFIGVSLEPDGGSAEPEELLGGVPTS